jgi:hypothetical protein
MPTTQEGNTLTTIPEWKNSATICALADGERHYGHIVKIDGRWYAFDATRSDREGTRFLRLGSYASVRSAKQAVERSAYETRLLFVGAA